MLLPQSLFADRYRIVKPLAKGGMGAVFVAQHTATEALVALKVLWPHVMEHQPARENFELEAKVAARVRSEHIVKVLDAGLDAATGAPFLAMELLEGATLAEYVAHNGPRPFAEVVDWMAQVARGLDAAHAHQSSQGMPVPIVHRDLKPENLFLTTGSHGAPLIKILDFGIAKVLSQSTHPSREVRGTPRYMAFEQVAGEEISPRTDVWAFGLITYFLMTGRCYWRSIDRVEALFAEILSVPMPAPSQRARADNPDIALPVAFDGWLLRCIDRNPSNRFASAGEAVRALAALEARAASGPVPMPVSAEPAAITAPTQTVDEGLRIAAISGSSVPSLTTGLPERVPVQGAQRALIAVVAVAVLAVLVAGLWVGWRRSDTGGASSAAAHRETTASIGGNGGTVHPSDSEPVVVPVTPRAVVSQSDGIAEPSPSSRPAPVTQRAKRASPRPLPSDVPPARSPAAAKSPPLFVELPAD